MEGKKNERKRVCFDDFYLAYGFVWISFGNTDRKRWALGLLALTEINSQLHIQ